jgi:hypothetical protein
VKGGTGADAAREYLHNNGDLHACPYGEEAEAQSKVMDALFLRERMDMVAVSLPPLQIWGLCPFCVLFDVGMVVTN